MFLVIWTKSKQIDYESLIEIQLILSHYSYAQELVTASEHIVNYLDAQDKEVAGTTYKQLRELVDHVQKCGYFSQGDQSAEQESAETLPTVEGFCIFNFLFVNSKTKRKIAKYSQSHSGICFSHIYNYF